MTTFLAFGLVSTVPKLPIVGFAIVQSELSFGHPGSSAPAALKAFRSMLADPSSVSWPGLDGSMSATDGPVRN